MPTTMTATLRLEISGSDTVTQTHALEVEAFDRIEVTVPAHDGTTAGTLTVDVHPGGSGQVQLIYIKAAAYPAEGDGTPQLSYAVDGGSDTALDAPLLLAGHGITTLLGDVNQIVYTNESSEQVTVEILVGRDATP